MINCMMGPEKGKYYDAEVHCFDKILVLVLNSFLGLRDLQSMSRVNKFNKSTVNFICQISTPFRADIVMQHLL